MICSEEGIAPITSKMLNCRALTSSIILVMVSLRVFLSWVIMVISSSFKVALMEVNRKEIEDKEEAFEDFLASIRNSCKKGE